MTSALVGGPAIAKKILVVDDDAEIVGFVELGLRSQGFEVLTAEDGETGLYAARAARPDLIVLDLAMPRMHGYEVCQAVRADKEIAATKIIITSGKNFPVDIKTAMSLGADLYMVKPYGLRELSDAIRKLLGVEDARRDRGDSASGHAPP